jgi:hypothetical protein
MTESFMGTADSPATTVAYRNEDAAHWFLIAIAIASIAMTARRCVFTDRIEASAPDMKFSAIVRIISHVASQRVDFAPRNTSAIAGMSLARV